MIGGYNFNDYKSAGAKNSKHKFNYQVIFGRQRFKSVDYNLEENPKFNEIYYMIVQNELTLNKKMNADSLCTS